jgi:hypothetical protein
MTPRQKAGAGLPAGVTQAPARSRDGTGGGQDA